MIPETRNPKPETRILYANQLVIDSRWAFRLCDPFWRLYFNRDAGAVVRSGEQRWAMPPCRATLLPPWCDVLGSCVGPVRHFYVHFETPALATDWVRRFCREPLMLPDDAVLRAMLDVLASETPAIYPDERVARWHIPDQTSLRPERADSRWRLRVQSAVAWALARGLALLDATAMAELDGGGDHALAPALQFVEQHLAEPLSVARLAHTCGISADRFARRFHGAVGRTPMRWVQERRIAAAAYRLIHSTTDLDSVARATGFANRFHFTRCFSRLVGTPPAQYRRQHRG